MFPSACWPTILMSELSEAKGAGRARRSSQTERLRHNDANLACVADASKSATAPKTSSMLTDAAPRKNRAEYLKSDQINTSNCPGTAVFKKSA